MIVTARRTTNAGSSGKMHALVDAYAAAKRHYLQQPGSTAPAPGLRGRLEKLRWKLSSRRR